MLGLSERIRDVRSDVPPDDGYFVVETCSRQLQLLQ